MADFTSSSSASSSAANPPMMSVPNTELGRRIQCFHCGEFFMVCQCKIPGQEAYQIMLDDHELPPSTATVEDKIQFWGMLLQQGQLTKRFNFGLFYEEQLMQRNAMTLIRNVELKRRFVDIWMQYTKSDHFPLLVKTFPKMSENDLKRVGFETWNSFFNGHWWELCRLSIMFVMNSLEYCGPNPFAPETLAMRVLADALQMVEVALKLGAPNEYIYSIVAPLRLTSMKDLVIFKRVPDTA